MAAKSNRLDYWRKYFHSSDTDIFEVIEYAIAVAASDCPKDFRLRRDRIAEKLFSCRLIQCSGCDRVELAVPHEEDEGSDPFKDSGKESKVNSSTNDCDELAAHRPSNYSYDEAEALTEEIEEESQIVGEALRIKEILGNHKDESDRVLVESLRRLQLMALSVETLKATEIGKAVNGLRKHGSKQIRCLARALIDGWKDMVDEWVNAAAAIAGGTPESANPAVADEQGLPSPPLDEGAFLATQTTSIELSQFFDGMDDDGNPRSNGEVNRNRGNGGKPTCENNNTKRSQQPPCKGDEPKEDKVLTTKQEVSHRQIRPANADVGPGRPAKTSMVQKANGDMKLQQRRDPVGVQKKPPNNLQDKSKYSDDLSVRVKMEATKRMLHEGYQQAENAKKQRTIQVMELHDLPKQGLGHRNPHLKPGLHNRHWSNGHR